MALRPVIPAARLPTLASQWGVALISVTEWSYPSGRYQWGASAVGDDLPGEYTAINCTADTREAALLLLKSKIDESREQKVHAA